PGEDWKLLVSRLESARAGGHRGTARRGLVTRRDVPVIAQELQDFLRRAAAQLLTQPANQVRMSRAECLEFDQVYLAIRLPKISGIALLGIDAAHLKQAAKRPRLIGQADFFDVVDRDMPAQVRIVAVLPFSLRQ